MTIHWVLRHPVFRQTCMGNGLHVMAVLIYIYIHIYILTNTKSRKMIEMGKNDDQWIN